MRKQESDTIGEHTYTVTQLGALQGRVAATRLARIVGPLMGSAGDAGAALGRLAGALHEDDVNYFCDLLAPLTTVSGGAYGSKAPRLQDIFDAHFAGHYFEMAKWLAFALKVNFGSFFDDLSRELGNAATDTSA